MGLPWPPLLQPPVALRPWGATPEDGEALAAAWGIDDIARWTSVPAEHDRAAADRWVRAESTRRDRGLAVDLVISELGSPERIQGEVGFALVEQEKRWAEVGYWLFPAYRGEGRAAIALTLFADWALRDQPIERLFARTSGDNPRSAKVAERAGFGAAGTLPDGTHVWVRDRRA